MEPPRSTRLGVVWWVWGEMNGMVGMLGVVGWWEER